MTVATEHPLGNPNPDPEPLPEPSIVDQILDLDAFLSADVRLPEKSARFCTKPDIQALIEDLHAELESLTDHVGKPLSSTEDADLEAGAGRSAGTVAAEIRALQEEYAAAFRTIRVRAMPEDKWEAFEVKWKEALAEQPPYPTEMWVELIVASAIAPKFTPEKVTAFRARAGHTAFTALANAAWRANTESGVSIPKSPLSSAVLRHTRR